MQLVIIAGGKGTRLGLKDIPKPMIKIAGRPLLEHQIELAVKYGIQEIFILSGHLSQTIIDYFGSGEKWGVKIHHLVESSPMGTAGCLKQLEGIINDRFLVFYGDVFMDFDIDHFIQYDHNDTGSLGTVLVHPNDHPYDSDLLELDSQNRIVSVIPKPHDNSEYCQNLVNAAVYIFSPEIFHYISSEKKEDIGRDILKKTLGSDGYLIGYRTAEYIKDMGTPERFETVCQDFLSGKTAAYNRKNSRPCIFLDRDGVINQDMGDRPKVDRFKLMQGVSKAIRKINRSGSLAIVITNQPAIAKGFTSEDDVRQTHKRMETELGREQAFLDGIYFCPHHPDKGFSGEISELKIDCECRKPKPGMLFQSAKDFNIDFKKSWMIGDHARDVLAGKNAGCRTVLLTENSNDSQGADFIAKNLEDAVDYILRMPDNDNN